MFFEIVRIDTGSNGVCNTEAKEKHGLDEREEEEVRRKAIKDKIWYK